MPKAAVVIISVLVLTLGGGLFLLFKPSGEGLPSPSPNPVTSPQSKASPQPTRVESPLVSIPENIVRYTSSGYSPASLKVKVGTTVSFQNNSNSSMWTATEPHPQHTGYPGSSISKCSSADKSTIFDACTGTPSGSSWFFTFDKVGTWEYHNHLSPSHTGTTLVEK